MRLGLTPSLGLASKTVEESSLWLSGVSLQNRSHRTLLLQRAATKKKCTKHCGVPTYGGNMPIHSSKRGFELLEEIFIGIY